MPILIDGNNLLFAAHPGITAPSPELQNTLCTRLLAWARLKRQSLHVIFDGPYPAAVPPSEPPALRVEFSGHSRSADDVICARIAVERQPRQWRVISTDREVVWSARHHGAASTRSEDFIAELRRDLARGLKSEDPPAKHAPPTREETDRWLRELGFDPDEAP